MKEIIMFAGNIGSGKAYMMNKKVQELKETGNSVYLVSFADPIKTFVKNFTGFDKNGNRLYDKPSSTDFYVFIQRFEKMLKFYLREIEFVNVQKYRSAYDTIIDNIFQEGVEFENHDLRLKAIRSLLQMVGTEIGQSYSKEIWPEIACSKILDIQSSSDYIIIDDFRFLFEYYNVIRNFPDVKVSPYYIKADIEVRAKRRGITIEELIEQEKHISEQESKFVILPWMELHFFQNIIVNNGV